jgi:hypothetical protein
MGLFAAWMPSWLAERTRVAFPFLTFLADVGHVHDTRLGRSLRVPLFAHARGVPSPPLLATAGVYATHRERPRYGSPPPRKTPTSSNPGPAPLAVSTQTLLATGHARSRHFLAERSRASGRNVLELSIIAAAHDHTTLRILRCKCTCPPPKAAFERSSELRGAPRSTNSRSRKRRKQLNRAVLSGDSPGKRRSCFGPEPPG